MTRTRLPIEPVSPERRELLRNLPGRIILLRRPGENAYCGYIENSFTMGQSPNETNFWSLYGAREGSKSHEEHAEKLRRDHPDYEVLVLDVQADDLPVTLDWDTWIDAQAFNPNTLSGVTDKYRARNIPFTMRDLEAEENTDSGLHASDCALHNEPAMPAGPCDCR